MGININNTVAPEDVPALARLLSANGFTRARYEIGWGSIDYETGELENAASVRKTLAALKRYRIRPLILLNAHHGRPCPTRPLDVRVATAAKRGARRIRLDAATAKQVAPRRSGINAPDGPGRGGPVHSRRARRNGNPFEAAAARPGSRQPSRQHAPVRAVCTASTLRRQSQPGIRADAATAGFATSTPSPAMHVRCSGDGNFDVEIWNELTFGSDFLYSDRYYEPAGVR